MTNYPTVSTFLWFESQAEEAAQVYTSLLPDSRIEHVLRPEADKPAMLVAFTLAGVPYQAFNGGPHYKLNAAASIAIIPQDQAETDKLWDALTAGGGAELQCGWLTDRFGLTWQITPAALLDGLNAEDEAAAGRVREAMMTMKKIDIAAIEAAFRGE